MVGDRKEPVQFTGLNKKTERASKNIKVEDYNKIKITTFFQ